MPWPGAGKQLEHRARRQLQDAFAVRRGNDGGDDSATGLDVSCKSSTDDLRQEVPAASLCGLLKKSCGLLHSTDLALVHELTQSATAFANPISCVTHSMVIPWLAITSSTSLISGSSAEVGSMILGVRHSARVCHCYNCCCGCWKAAADTCRPGRRCAPARVAAWPSLRRPCGSSPTHIGDSVRFSSTVRCGNRLNRWNAGSRTLSIGFHVRPGERRQRPSLAFLGLVDAGSASTCRIPMARR